MDIEEVTECKAFGVSRCQINKCKTIILGIVYLKLHNLYKFEIYLLKSKCVHYWWTLENETDIIYSF